MPLRAPQKTKLQPAISAFAVLAPPSPEGPLILPIVLIGLVDVPVATLAVSRSVPKVGASKPVAGES